MGITSIVLLTKHNTKMDGAKWFGKVSTFVFYTVMFIICLLYTSRTAPNETSDPNPDAFSSPRT